MYERVSTGPHELQEATDCLAGLSNLVVLSFPLKDRLALLPKDSVLPSFSGSSADNVLFFVESMNRLAVMTDRPT